MTLQWKFANGLTRMVPLSWTTLWRTLGWLFKTSSNLIQKLPRLSFWHQRNKKVKDQLKLYDSLLSSCDFEGLAPSQISNSKSLKHLGKSSLGAPSMACRYNPTRADKEPLRPLYMYYKKLKQGIIASKTSVRKSSVTVRKQAVLTERTQSQGLTSHRRSYDGFKRSKNVISDTSSVSSLGKENVSQNVSNNSVKSSKKEKDAIIRKLMKQRENLTKVNYSIPLWLFLGAQVPSSPAGQIWEGVHQQERAEDQIHERCQACRQGIQSLQVP